ncbi:MAG: tesB [Frankiales bacterium]|nr:tesB [Frankiales bacterium]
MVTPLENLVAVLDLERIEVDIFRGRQPPDHGQSRVFGGQVAAQALVAAGRTVEDDRPVNSLHAYFLRPGDPRVPIVYQVDRIRDGRSFTTRRVVALQHGKAIFNLSASFQLPEEGPAFAESMPDVPDPETLPTWEELLRPHAERLRAGALNPSPIDVRYITDPPVVAAKNGVPVERSLIWMKADGRLPDDPLVHVCATAWASDYTLIDAATSRHPTLQGSGARIASLDHAMWFHRPFRADEWFLYDQESSWTGSGRGLARGHIFTHDGHLAVTVVQEGSIRVSPPTNTGAPQ